MSSFNTSSSRSNTYTTSNNVSAPLIEKILLPTQVIERPVAIHEEIRKELIEEIQPVINVEKTKTEVHQVTQPLFDKEVRAVTIENRTLNTEVLPEVFVQGRGARAVGEVSTTRFLDTQTKVIEKPALYNEVERRQIIEEIQPVIYKETIVPTVIQETKPVFQKIVEGPVYSQETLSSRSVAQPSMIAPSYVPSTTVSAPTQQRVVLPTQFVEKPTAVHEEIRRETIEEIQPVVNVEKIKTEVHQITAPLFDKEVKPVMIERRILAQEVLPEVQVSGSGVRSLDDFSTTRYLDTKSTLIEKPAIYNEIERTQVIEEIQPVVYKETVVPTVIRETKPVFQKIVEGPVYSQQTLPPRSLNESNYKYPTTGFEEIASLPLREAPVVREISFTQSPVPVERLAHVTLVEAPLQRKEILEEVITTTTTTSAPAVSQAKHHHHLFHRHAKDTTSAPRGSSDWNSSTGAQSSMTGAPVEHLHNERMGSNGQKIVEDTTITRNHAEAILPARVI